MIHKHAHKHLTHTGSGGYYDDLLGGVFKCRIWASMISTGGSVREGEKMETKRNACERQGRGQGWKVAVVVVAGGKMQSRVFSLFRAFIGREGQVVVVAGVMGFPPARQSRHREGSVLLPVTSRPPHEKE